MPFAPLSRGITFDFEANSGQWRATGLLTADSLTVRYNEMMRLDDFVDGVYVRAP
jgi:hypothetical protein